MMTWSRWLCVCVSLVSLTFGAPTASASTSSEMVARSPVGQYAGIKQAIADLYSNAGLPQPPKSYDVFSCSRTGADYIEGGKGQLIADLAFDVATWTGDLATLGYPRAVWKPMLDDYEASVLGAMASYKGSDWSYDSPLSDTMSKLQSGFEHRLVDALRTYHRAGHPSLVPVIYQEGGCGGGNPGVDVIIKTQPRGAQVRLIPVFYYKLCRLQKLDPDNSIDCDHWSEADDGSRRTIAGKYYYEWKDRPSTLYQLDDSNKQDGEIVVLRQP